MAIVIKPDAMKYRDANGDYKGVDIVAETATATQVAAVAAEGATQIQEIQNKADAAMSLIPSETTLTDLSNDFAAQYSSSSAYAVGAYCMHEYKLYRCNTAIASGGEAWTAAHWTLVNTTNELTNVKNTLTDEVDNLKSALTSVENKMEVSQSAASFLWTMGKGILSNGSVANNSSACISSKTKLIKDLGFINRNTSYNGYQMNLNIVEYSGSTFLRRVSVENGSSYFLSADADSFIIMCSFISTSGVTMNDEILTSCWKVSFIDMLVNTREYAQTKNTLLKLLNDAIYVNEGNKSVFFV